MADANRALDVLFRLEGFHGDHELDPGGETRYGISREYWPEYWEDGPPTKAEARHFWLHEFWEPMQLGRVHSQEIADEMLDQAANFGRRRAVRLAQYTTNLIQPPGRPDIAVDGVVGPETLGALNDLNMGDRLRWVKAANGIQFTFYLYRTDRLDRALDLFATFPDPEQETFLRGWLRRIGAWLAGGEE